MTIPKEQTILANLPYLIDHWRLTFGEAACWNWPYGATGSGYGAIVVGKGTVQAHRFVYGVVVGPVPADLVVDHRCRNRRCVNPAHLEPVTQKVNVQRKVPSNYRKPRKTHCKYGHAFDERNTFIQANGAQGCRMCRRLAQRAKIGWKGNTHGSEKTHCKYGHPFSPENTIIRPRGTFNERVCRTCTREKERALRAKRKQTA